MDRTMDWTPSLRARLLMVAATVVYVIDLLFAVTGYPYLLLLEVSLGLTLLGFYCAVRDATSSDGPRQPR